MYTIPKDTKVSLSLYDASGRLVKDCTSLLNYLYSNNQITWDGTDDSGTVLPPGVYFIELRGQDRNQTKKLIKLK